MYYKNYTEDAVLELERQRTQTYEDTYQFSKQSNLCCEECGSSLKKLHNINSHTFCEDCICDSLREVYDSIEQNMTVLNIDALEILKDILSDFSDNELLCYVENRYEEV